MHGLHGWQHARHGWQHARHGRHARRESQGRCEDFWAVPITIFQIFQDLAATSWGPQDI